ncbi:MAG: Spy/CpxP family protein refolding chaperone [Nannocystaceae bacterium]
MTTLTTRILLGLASFGLVGLLGATPAYAHAGGEKRSPEARVERLCAELACTPAQKAKILEIKAAGRTPQATAAHDQLRALKQQMRAEREKASPDATVIERLKGQITAQKAVLHGEREATQKKVAAVLTPAQRTKYQAHLDARAKRHEGKRHGEGKRGEGKRDGKGKGKGKGKGQSQRQSQGSETRYG